MNFQSLSQSEIQILLGGLLGDSYYNKKRNIIRFAHSEKQKEYLIWKYSFFNDDKKSRVYNYERKVNDKTYYGNNFEIKLSKNGMSDFIDFTKKNLYTNDGRKKISLKYLNALTPLGIAVWWLDDGSLSVHKGNRYGKLCTHCFNYEENILIQKYFKKQWNIDVDIKVEKDKYYFIRFNVSALKQLVKIIYPYVIQIPSMIYKIDLNYTNKVNMGDFQEIYNIIKNVIKGTLETTGYIW